MKSYKIHLIRHGAIEDTLSGAYIGTTDVPLSDEGKRQLKLLDHNMDYPYASVVFTSPLKRCKETCKIIYNNIEPIIVFNKCDMGSFAEYEEIYRKSGFEVHTVSCLTGEGVDELLDMANDPVTEVKCHFCDMKYRFTPDEIRKLAEKI